MGDRMRACHGLETAVSLEMTRVRTRRRRPCLHLKRTTSAPALFGEWQHVKEGEPVRRTGGSQASGREKLLAASVDPLGTPLDG